AAINVRVSYSSIFWGLISFYFGELPFYESNLFNTKTPALNESGVNGRDILPPLLLSMLAGIKIKGIKSLS
ncbi:MAG: hypothetical protein QNK11_09035, partial [Legionella sp.]|nr:hypothetical protein [Legionella sp.]